jgi:hypothetical protein
MEKNFEIRFAELEKRIPDDLRAKIAEIANKQSEEHDYSKKKSTVWAQIVATLSIALIGGYFTISSANEQEKNRTSQLAEQEKNRTSQITEQEKNNKVMMATQLMSQREKSETDFRQTMFLPLIQQILNDKLPLRKRMDVFELFENNFNDLFNSRSLYDVLWEKAEKEKNAEIKHKLISLARYTDAKQELQINKMEYRKSLTGLPEQDTIDYTFEDSEGGERVKIHLDSIDENYILVTMTVKCNGSDRKCRTIKINNGSPFHISYFDTPLSSNFIMPDGDRIAVILEEIDLRHNPKSARLDIVHFPADYVTVGYRPSIEKVNEILESKD